MSHRLLEQLNKLQSVKPDLNWQSQLRSSLVTRARIDTIDRQLTFLDHFSLFSMVFYKKYLPSPYKMASALAILVIISGTSIMARAEYVPQRPLYSVKRAFEKVEFVFAVTPEQETQLHLKHAKNRLNEVDKIVADTSDSVKKAENLNTVIKSMEQNITAAKNGLEIVKDSADTTSTNDNQKTVSLAKEITESTNTAIKTLDQVQSSVDLTGVAKTVNEATFLVEDANSVSLRVLVDSANNQPIDNQLGVSKEEVKDFISQKLERSEEKLKQAQVIAGNATDSSVGSKNDLNLKDAVKKNSEAQVVVKEAKNLLNSNDLPQALNKVEQVSDITKESTGSLNKITDIKDGLLGSSSESDLIFPTSTKP